MKHLLRYLLLVVLWFSPLILLAQITKWQDIYEVKKKDTVFSIAKKYSITIKELMDANPEMKIEGYELKKGDTIFIPYKSGTAESASKTLPVNKLENKLKTIKVGVMLPLHNVNGDGRRMLEYYRGMLMACDSLKREGISTDIQAWNVPIDADIRQILLQKGAKDCNLIFGPLYTSQVKTLGDFCAHNGIKLIFPFYINGDEMTKNTEIFRVYQDESDLANDAIEVFARRFSKSHPVFIDCNDPTSNKGVFTFGLRKVLEQQGIDYSITNLKSSESSFLKAFSRNKSNIVVLNTGRSPELNVALAKLEGLTTANPGIMVTLFGYTEWLMYTKYNLEIFFKFNTYIPSTFYYNPLDPKTQNLEKNYHKWFGQEMLQALPKFAISGYDQTQFFVRGYNLYGETFIGTREQSSYRPLQMPLHFKRVIKGMQNANFMLIHFTPEQRIESISY